MYECHLFKGYFHLIIRPAPRMFALKISTNFIIWILVVILQRLVIILPIIAEDSMNLMHISLMQLFSDAIAQKVVRDLKEGGRCPNSETILISIVDNSFALTSSLK
jgi:hypothetical protein